MLIARVPKRYRYENDRKEVTLELSVTEAMLVAGALSMALTHTSAVKLGSQLGRFLDATQDSDAVAVLEPDQEPSGSIESGPGPSDSPNPDSQPEEGPKLTIDDGDLFNTVEIHSPHYHVECAMSNGQLIATSYFNEKEEKETILPDWSQAVVVTTEIPEGGLVFGHPNFSKYITMSESMQTHVKAILEEL